MPVASPQDTSRPAAGPSSSRTGKGKDSAPVRPVEEPFDIVGAYRRAHEENDVCGILSLFNYYQYKLADLLVSSSSGGNHVTGEARSGV